MYVGYDKGCEERRAAAARRRQRHISFSPPAFGFSPSPSRAARSPPLARRSPPRPAPAPAPSESAAAGAAAAAAYAVAMAAASPPRAAWGDVWHTVGKAEQRAASAVRREQAKRVKQPGLRRLASPPAPPRSAEELAQLDKEKLEKWKKLENGWQDIRTVAVLTDEWFTDEELKKKTTSQAEEDCTATPRPQVVRGWFGPKTEKTQEKKGVVKASQWIAPPGWTHDQTNRRPNRRQCALYVADETDLPFRSSGPPLPRREIQCSDGALPRRAQCALAIADETDLATYVPPETKRRHNITYDKEPERALLPPYHWRSDYVHPQRRPGCDSQHIRPRTRYSPYRWTGGVGWMDETPPAAPQRGASAPLGADPPLCADDSATSPPRPAQAPLPERPPPPPQRQGAVAPPEPPQPSRTPPPEAGGGGAGCATGGGVGADGAPAPTAGGDRAKWI